MSVKKNFRIFIAIADEWGVWDVLMTFASGLLWGAGFWVSLVWVLKYFG